MRVIIGHDASLTGAPFYILSYLRWVKANDPDLQVVVILRNGGDLLEEYKKLYQTFLWVNPERISNRWLYYLHKFLEVFFRIKIYKHFNRRIIRAVKHKGPIELIFNNTCTNFEIVDHFKDLDAPIVSRIPEMEFVMKSYNAKGEVNKLLNLSTRLIAVSSAVRENLVNNFDQNDSKIDVFYGISPRTNRMKSNHGASEEFIVGMSGSLSWRKGVDLLPHIIHQVVRVNGSTNIKFIWVGVEKDSLELAQLLFDLDRMNLRDYFIDEPKSKTPELAYANFGCYLMLSREDPYPLVLSELAELKVPIIGYRNSGGPEEFLSNSNGIVLDYLDVVSTGKEIVRLAHNLEYCLKVAENAFEFVQQQREKYSFDHLNSLLNNVSNRILKASDELN